MVTVDRARDIALKENPGSAVNETVRYGNYYVFFIQPEGVDPNSDEAIPDNYVFVNSDTGKIEYKSPLMFPDFIDKAISM